MADLHFDPFLSCHQRPCPLIKALHQAPVEQWHALFSQYDDSAVVYGKDSNFFLLESSLAVLQKEAKIHPIEFVLAMGDFLAHRFHQKYLKYAADNHPEHYVSFIKKTLSFLTLELQRAFPQTNVYMIIGNNDSYQDNYVSEPRGRFFDDLSKLNVTLIQDPDARRDLLRDFPIGGYYSVKISQQPKLRLIVLNSVLFANPAKGRHISQAAEEELNWLHQVLLSAKAQQERVLISMHIPGGIDVYKSFFNLFGFLELWKSQYSQRFLTEIQQAAPQMMGILTAHIHGDTFQLFTTENGVAIPISSTSSISPVYYNRPGFKMYSYAYPALKLTNYMSYQYTLSNKQWVKEHDFKKIDEADSASRELINDMRHVQPLGKHAQKYQQFYRLHDQNQFIH